MAYYRFVDKPDNEAVTVENIMQPHRLQTLRRMQGEKTVLCVQDGSTLNFAKRGKTEGLGITNQTGAGVRGLNLHTTIAVNTEGLPLGVLRAAFDAPQPGAEKNKPREEKKSYRRGSSGQRRGCFCTRQRAGGRRHGPGGGLRRPVR